MKTHYSIFELLEINLEKLPKTDRAILYKAKRENWSFIEAPCQGGRNGKRREYRKNTASPWRSSGRFGRYRNWA